MRRSSSLRLPADLSSASRARTFVGQTLSGHVDDLATVMLMTSELVTNVALHANTDVTVTVHEGFEFWVSDVDGKDDLAAALDQANAAASPTARLTQVAAAYWTDVGTKEHLRWVMPEPEDALLDALARLHVAGKDVIVDGARLVGMFRAHGLLTPVWDLPLGTGPEALEDPASTFAEDLAAALADGSDLTADQRAARSGLANRQVTIR